VPIEPLDVVGIGNALVDVLSHEAESFIDANELVKGSMTLIDTDRAEALYGAMGAGIEASGGSAANTISGIASFGGAAGFIGRVFDDQLGAVFGHDMRSSGVRFSSPAATAGEPTGRCLIVVTPDAQRTMNTYLGAAADLGPDDVDEEMIASATVTYLEGYLFDKSPAKEAYRKASRIAHEAGNRVALTLSDTFCVERHHAEWVALVTESVDILFGNEQEFCTLYRCQTVADAVDAVRRDCEIACLTLGAKGSMIVTADEVHEIDAHPVGKVLDTTGAGDLYAAGFLYGYTQGRDLAASGRLGSIAASAVLGHTGARPELSLAQLVDTSGA
jgi:sugar/nucleoside kinase (ribokinase family)